MMRRTVDTSFLAFSLLWILVCACSVDKEKLSEKLIQVKVPDFNADSAYYFVEKQVSFGPRIPNTQAHRRAGDYLVNQFKRYGATVTEQEFEATSFDHQNLELRNIIAAFNPEASTRILLAAHWDTRPFADRDSQNRNALFDGANDGASGVGVLLEIARVLSKQDSQPIGVDIILFDGEDGGEREGDQHRNLERRGRAAPLEGHPDDHQGHEAIGSCRSALRRGSRRCGCGRQKTDILFALHRCAHGDGHAGADVHLQQHADLGGTRGSCSLSAAATGAAFPSRGHAGRRPASAGDPQRCRREPGRW